MGLGNNHYSLAVKSAGSFDGFSDDGLIVSGCLVFVYVPGTKTLATIYADDIGTAKTNPISRAQFALDKKVDFWSASASVDIAVNDDRGNYHLSKSALPGNHSIPLDRSGESKHLIAPFVSVSGANVETDTALQLPYECVVEDCIVEVTAIQSAQTINVGLLSTQSGGVASGFIAAQLVSALGVIDNEAVTVGTTETFISSLFYGSLLGAGKVGSNVAHDQGIPGGYRKYKIQGTAAQNISYTMTSAATSAAGYIHTYFRHLR